MKNGQARLPFYHSPKSVQKKPELDMHESRVFLLFFFNNKQLEPSIYYIFLKLNKIYNVMKYVLGTKLYVKRTNDC